MIELNEIKSLTNRHIWSSITINTAVMAIIALAVSLFFPQSQSEYVSASAIATTFGVVEIIVLMKVWMRIVFKDLHSLPTFYTASSGFRMLAALTTLFVVYIFVGRDSMFPFFIVFVISYFLLLILHTLFFKKMTEKLM